MELEIMSLRLPMIVSNYTWKILKNLVNVLLQIVLKFIELIIKVNIFLVINVSMTNVNYVNSKNILNLLAKNFNYLK